MKNIILFASPGGGGHISNARAIKSYFQDQQDPINIHIADQWAILKLSYMVNIYNFCLKHNLIGLYENMIRPILQGVGILLRSESWLPNVLEKYFSTLENKPDLIISNSPIMNNVIARAIQLAWPVDAPPFLITILDPVDYKDRDMKYITDNPNTLKGQLNTQPYFLCCTEMQEMQVLEAGHDRSKIIMAKGFTIDRQFRKFREQSQSDKQDFRKHLKFSDDLPVIVLSLGAQGGEHLYEIGKHLSRSSLKAHYVFICGHSTSTRDKLRTLRFNHPVAIEGFVKDLGRYLSIADYYIGKPGPGSIAEALYMQLPCFIVTTNYVMEQEVGNIDLIKQNNLGDWFTQPEALIKRLGSELGKDIESLYPNLKKFEENNGLEVAYKTIKQFVGLDVKDSPSTCS